jgi:hypothetical protein
MGLGKPDRIYPVTGIFYPSNILALSQQGKALPGQA